MAVAVGDQRRNKEAQEFLVQEIAKGDEDGIPNLLRTAIERGWYSSIPGFLVEAKKKKETEIDRICSRHYTDFLGSVNELLKMKGSVQELMGLVNEINGKFSSTGGELVETLNDLTNIQSERDHCKRLLESATACKELSGLLMEVRLCLERDQLYQAMRLIQQIQGEQTNPSIRPMSRHLQTWLPIAKNKLLYAARSEADAFIESLRDKMGIMGETLLLRQSRASLQYYYTSVMNATLTEGGFEGNYMKRELSLTQTARDYANPMTVSGRASIALGYILLNSISFRLTSHIGKSFHPESYISTHFCLSYNKEGAELVDFKLGEIAPLHKALHIYHELGIVSNFHDHFRYDRREVFTKLLKAFERNANSMGLMRAVPKFFEDLTGFFAIECIMGNMIETNNEIFSKVELEVLWIEAMTKLRDISLQMGITLTSPAELLQLKEEMLLLLHMMADEIIGMDMSVLMTVMWTLFDSFDALAVQHLTQQIRDALDQSAFQRYVVTSPEVYQLQIKHFRLDLIDVNQDTPQQHLQQSIHKYGAKTRGPMSGASAPSAGGITNGNSGGVDSGLTSSNAGAMMMDVDAQLDALEQEMGLSTVNPSYRNGNVFTSSSTTSSGSGGTGAGDALTSPYPSRTMGGQGSSSFVPVQKGIGNNTSDDAQAKFITQTYPFSAFVPIMLTELHFALVRLFLFVMVPAPESWTRHRRQQDKVARLVAAQGGSNGSVLEVSAGALEPHDATGNRSTTPTQFLAPGSRSNNKGASNNNRSTTPPPAALAANANSNVSVGNIMLHLASVANIHITDFLCRNLLGLFALLCDQLQACLQRDGLETALSKACQIAIDSTFIALSVDFYFSLLETNLDLLFGADSYDPNLLAQTQEIVLQRLRRVSSQAQDLIFELLANKIDALLESLQFIDYAPEYPPIAMSPNPSGQHTQQHQQVSFMVNLGAANTAWVHESIDSLVEFLTITFMCFTHLPQSVREAVHFTSCAKLAHGILDFLLSDRVPKINIYALVALDADVKRLMAFADSCGIPDLRHCFDELHEMIKAVLHPDLAQLGEDMHFRMKLFPHVSAEKLAQLLDKVVTSPVSAAASNLPRLERQSVKITSKRLRGQQQQQLHQDAHGGHHHPSYQNRNSANPSAANAGAEMNNAESSFNQPGNSNNINNITNNNNNSNPALRRSGSGRRVSTTRIASTSNK
jgi:hypothetical protein